jgi:hypothetical protein
LLRQIFKHTPRGFVTVWAKSETGNITRWFDLSEADALHQAQQAAVDLDARGYDVYFSTCPARSSGENGAGKARIKAADVACVPAFFMDIDTLLDESKLGKRLPVGVPEAVAALDALPCPPTICVSSGHGVHAYWVLREPMAITSPQDLESAKRLLRSFADAVVSATGFSDCDAHASEPSRVLRVPETSNHKMGQLLPVEVIERAQSPEYDLMDLRTFVCAQEDRLSAKVDISEDNEGSASPFDEEQQLLDKARRADPSLDSLFRGDWKGRYPSQSEADLALCSKLAFWFQKDAVRIDRFFRQSSLFRPKWDEKHHGDGSTYGQKTVEMAISGCRDVYVPQASYHQGNDSLDEQSLNSNPGGVSAAQTVRDKQAAARAERKAQEKRDAEMGLVIRQAAAINLAGPAKPAFESIIAYTARELRARDIKPTPVIVDGLLPAGFSILAGAPKRGKSWMALDLAISVATGRPFLGRRTLKGKVLYLDLESGESRAKKRLSILLPGEWPEDLYITHRADMLGDNGKLLLQIEEWLDKNPDTRLIIVDTIGRVKGGGRRTENAYETDTRLFGALQALAVARGIAILGIHHYKKGVEDGDDWFEKISGSMGLTGVCDTVLALTGKRDEQDCVLKSSSRDFEGIGDMVLRFDGGSWVVQGTDPHVYATEKAYCESGVVRGVLALLDTQPEWQGTPTQLLDAVGEVYHGQLETYNASKFSTALERVMGQLYDRDGVVIVRKKVKGHRVFSIRKGSADML